MALTILADDLTGACDTGALFAGRGPVAVTLCPGRPSADREVWVLDSESRSLPPAEAAARLAEAVGFLPASRRSDRVLKKIDSSFRGAVGAETEALLRATGAPGALVCPAFPRQGRTVLGGSLRIGGEPVHETAVGRDPDFRASTSDLIRILETQVSLPVRPLPLALVRAPHRDLAAALGKSGGLVVADAETDADLDRLAEAALALSPPPLLAGSAGLAGALATRLGCAGPPATFPARSAWLIVAGSFHPATHAQIRMLEASGVSGVRLVPPAAQAEAAVRVVAHLLHARRPAFVAVEPPLAPPISPERHLVASTLARVVVGIFEETTPDLLVLVGGETAVAVYQALKADSIEIAGAPEPGLALGRFRGGLAEGVTLLTKAGGFGVPDLFSSRLERSAP